MPPLTRLPISSDVGDTSADVRRLFEELSRQRPERRHQIAGECLPLLDVFETHDAFDLLLDVPGLTTANLRILVKAGVVIIAGEKDRPDQSALHTVGLEQDQCSLHDGCHSHDLRPRPDSESPSGRGPRLQSMNLDPGWRNSSSLHRLFT